jgi:hypothetical protein
VQRIGDGASDVDLGGEVIDDLRAQRREPARNGLGVRHVHHLQAGAFAERPREVGARALRQVVDGDHLVARPHQRVDEMRGDEARASGDECAHGASLFRFGCRISHGSVAERASYGLRPGQAFTERQIRRRESR